VWRAGSTKTFTEGNKENEGATTDFTDDTDGSGRRGMRGTHKKRSQKEAKRTKGPATDERGPGACGEGRADFGLAGLTGAGWDHG